MRRTLAVFLVLLFVAHVSAQTFSANVAARFQLPCTGASNYNPDSGSACRLNPVSQNTAWSSGNVQISWGTGAVSGYTSAMNFTSYQNVVLGVNSNSPSVIGQLVHSNFPINCGSDCNIYIPTNFALSLLMNVSLAGTYATFTQSYAMYLDETPNTDGRNPYPTGSCPYNPHEISWDTYAGGWTTAYPCCPYYTAVAVPSGGISSQYPLNGPCSDRISFTSATGPGTFRLGGYDYTVAIAGFSSSPTNFNSKVTFFTSQENQLQTAYLYAYVIRKCSDVSGCNDNKQCTIDSCTSGLCSNTNQNDGTLCTDSVNPPYDASNTCVAFKCKSGSCIGSNKANGGSCTNPNAAPGGTTSDCVNSVCNSGACQWVKKTGGSCTLGTPSTIDSQCQHKSCYSGSCRTNNINAGQDCKANNAEQGSAVRLLPSCNQAKCTSGTCKYSFINSGGSCSAITATVCNRRVCKSITRSTATVGTCRGSAQPGGSCTTITALECNQRKCAKQAVGSFGSCQYTAVTSGSCTGKTAVLCQARKCVLGANSLGSCRQSADSSAGSCASGFTVKECFKRTCSNGACTQTANGGGSCTSASAVNCKKRICTTAGSCGLQVNTAQGSCQSGFTAKDCYKRSCSNGNCLQTIVSGGSCTKSALVICKKRSCDTAGSCVYAANPGQGSCQSVYTAKDCYKRTCNSAGSCSQSVNSGGSCTKSALVVCKKRSCDGAGSCVYSANSGQGSCQSVYTAKECFKRTCNSAGSCSQSANGGGSCTSASAVNCKKRICTTAGSCGLQVNTAQGSCQSGFTAKDCYKRSCSNGNCLQTIVSGGSCTKSALVICKKRSCDTAGSCVYSANQNQGSCQSAYTAKECTARLCTSAGSCRQGASNQGGSCTSLTAILCRARTCNSGTCASSVVSAGGSCALGFTAKSCYKRTCDGSGNCVQSGNSAQGSCTTIGVTECKNRKCDTTGSCVPSNYASPGGSCTSINAVACHIRQCGTNGACSTSAISGGSCATIAASACNKRKCLSGSCVGSYLSGSGSCSSSLAVKTCYIRTCSNVGGAGQCAYAYKSGTCNNGFSTNDRSCFTQRCASRTGAGTCSTSVRVAKTCSAVAARPCAAPVCDATGNCGLSAANYPSTKTCTQSGKTGSFCNPLYCDGAGSCVNNLALNEGQSCLSGLDAVTAEYCVTSKCSAGICYDTSLLSQNNTQRCDNNKAGDTTCVGYFCRYRSNSQFNKMGTCLRQVDSSQIGAQCVIPGNDDSEADQRCYRLTCDSSGNCAKQITGINGFCDTPPNTVVTNGFGCSQYVCSAGTCNTHTPIAITNGSACAGSVPCDPAQPGCYSECQRFVCYGGECTLDYFREGQNCTYIKYLTARDGSLVEVRDSEGGTTTTNECTTGRCYQGKCTAYKVQNGTACGNRTANNDLCYNDYCDSTGTCVHTGRRNCAGVLPLPSVCWDVTCEASSGDCVLIANGVVDCSCINDCSACVALFDITSRNKTGGRTLGCYWCTGSKDVAPACFNRYLPGSSVEIAAPSGHGKCYTNKSPCGGGGGLTGGQVAGIVIGVLGLTSLAMLVMALAILLLRYFAASGTPPANASLTDLAFDSNVKNNVFYEGANLEGISSLYAAPQFITN